MSPFVEVKGTKVHYLEKGSGRPIIIFHGLFGWAKGMALALEPIFTKLDNYRRIYIEHLGNGESGAPEWVSSTDQMLEVITNVIEELVGNEPFVVVGTSYGAYLGRGLLKTKLHQVMGLCLLAPLVHGGEDRTVPTEITSIYVDQHILSALSPQEREQINAGATGMAVVNQETLELARTVYSQVMFETSNAAFLYRIRQQAYSYTFDIASLDRDFTKPVLVVAGRQDKEVGFEEAHELALRYPRGTYVALDGAGHGLMIEQRKVLEALIINWVQKMECLDEHHFCVF